MIGRVRTNEDPIIVTRGSTPYRSRVIHANIIHSIIPKWKPNQYGLSSKFSLIASRSSSSSSMNLNYGVGKYVRPELRKVKDHKQIA